MKRPSTELIHRGEGKASGATPLTTPIYGSTAYVFKSAADLQSYLEGRHARFLYSRHANPTVEAVESKLAAVEHAEAALLCSSGMAATATALIGLLEKGDEVVCASTIYGGTLHLLRDILSRFGVTPRFVGLDELSAPASWLGDRTRVLWFESPANPTLCCVDIEVVAAACRSRGVTSIIDSTFASPINQTPIDLGVDVVMHSATKYLSGHSDVVAGALASSRAIFERLDRTRRLLGTVLDPGAAYAVGRGLKTLGVRVERQNATALAIAEFLEQQPGVGRVYYPGLTSHPDCGIARAQMRGFGGVVCVDLDGGFAHACRLFDRLQIFKRAVSLGGVESLCSLPVLTSHHGLTDEELSRAGVTSGMVRLSVGVEDQEDLIADVRQALA